MGNVIIPCEMFINNAAQEFEATDLFNLGVANLNLQGWNSASCRMDKHTLGLGCVQFKFVSCHPSVAVIQR